MLLTAAHIGWDLAVTATKYFGTGASSMEVPACQWRVQVKGKALQCNDCQLHVHCNLLQDSQVGDAEGMLQDMIAGMLQDIAAKYNSVAAMLPSKTQAAVIGRVD